MERLIQTLAVFASFFILAENLSADPSRVARGELRKVQQVSFGILLYENDYPGSRVTDLETIRDYINLPSILKDEEADRLLGPFTLRYAFPPKDIYLRDNKRIVIIGSKPIVWDHPDNVGSKGGRYVGTIDGERLFLEEEKVQSLFAEYNIDSLQPIGGEIPEPSSANEERESVLDSSGVAQQVEAKKIPSVAKELESTKPGETEVETKDFKYWIIIGILVIVLSGGVVYLYSRHR